MELRGCRGAGNLMPDIEIEYLRLLRQKNRGCASEAHTPCFCGGNPFGLPPTDIFSLIFGDKGQDFEHDTADEFAHQPIAGGIARI